MVDGVSVCGTIVRSLSEDADASGSTLAVKVDGEVGKKGEVGVTSGVGSARVEIENARDGVRE